MPVPAGLNWELFQGPAPKKPYKTGRQRQWRNYWDYGGGTVTDWGVHLVDTALWFMDAQLKAPKWPWAWGSTSTSRPPIRSGRSTRSPRAGSTTRFVMSFSNAGDRQSRVPVPWHGLHRPARLAGREPDRLHAAAIAARAWRRPRRPEAPALPWCGPGWSSERCPAGTRAAPAPPMEAQMVRGGPEMEMVVTATTLHVTDFLELREDASAARVAV